VKTAILTQSMCFLLPWSHIPGGDNRSGRHVGCTPRPVRSVSAHGGICLGAHVVATRASDCRGGSDGSRRVLAPASFGMASGWHQQVGKVSIRWWPSSGGRSGSGGPHRPLGLRYAVGVPQIHVVALVGRRIISLVASPIAVAAEAGTPFVASRSWSPEHQGPYATVVPSASSLPICLAS